MATNFSPCKGSYVLNQFPSNVMFAMNGFTYQPVERYRAIMALLFLEFNIYLNYKLGGALEYLNYKLGGALEYLNYKLGGALKYLNYKLGGA